MMDEYNSIKNQIEKQQEKTFDLSEMNLSFIDLIE